MGISPSKIFGYCSDVSQDTSRLNLKLEAQKVKEFNGDFDEWARWKSRTECALDGSGYEKILTDITFAMNNPRMNRVVYSQLAVATVEGTAYHLVRQYDEEKDGHAAWSALCTWFDGDQIRNETSETLRAKLEGLKLHSGTTASQFVNKFLMWHMELDKIPGEGYSSSHAVYLFLKNIVDKDYDSTVTFLRNNGSNLNDCINALRKAERDLSQKRSERRKMRQFVRRAKSAELESSDEEEYEKPSSRKRRKKNHEENYITTTKPRKLAGKITTTQKGFISFPYDEWKKLEEEDKVKIQEYNARLKHGESTDDIQWPQGVTIVTKSRRIGKEKESAEETEVADGKEKEKKKNSKKKIRFNLEPEYENESEL